MAEPIGRGVDALLAVGVETEWGTEVVVTQIEPFVSETFSPRHNQIDNPALIGVSGFAKSDQGTLIIDNVGWTSTFSYRLFNKVLANFFGNTTTPDPSDANLRHYNLVNSTFGTGLTVAIQKQVSVHTFTGFRAGQLTITGTPTDGLRYQVTGVAKNHVRDSATNTSAVMTALLASDAPIKNGLFINHEFRVAALGGDLTLAGSLYKISSMTLDMNRGLAQPEVDAINRLEPLEDAKRVISLRVTVPRYTSDVFWNWHSAHQLLFGTLSWDDNAGLSKQIQLNKMVVSTPPGNPVSGPQAITQEIEFRCFTDSELDNDDADFDFTNEVRLIENGP